MTRQVPGVLETPLRDPLTYESVETTETSRLHGGRVLGGTQGRGETPASRNHRRRRETVGGTVGTRGRVYSTPDWSRKNRGEVRPSKSVIGVKDRRVVERVTGRREELPWRNPETKGSQDERPGRPKCRTRRGESGDGGRLRYVLPSRLQRKETGVARVVVSRYCGGLVSVLRFSGHDSGEVRSV